MLDIGGRKVRVTETQLELLREAAAAHASSSSVLRDLSLVLDRALRSGQVVALRRAEARALAQLVATQAHPELVELKRSLAAVTRRGSSPRPVVEILYFEGCPNYEAARAMVERVSAELGIDPELRLIEVADEEAAAQLRFLGSPTIRVGGSDVEAGAEDRGGFTRSCRVYRTEAGLAGQPEERWVRDALHRVLQRPDEASP